MGQDFEIWGEIFFKGPAILKEEKKSEEEREKGREGKKKTSHRSITIGPYTKSPFQSSFYRTLNVFCTQYLEDLTRLLLRFLLDRKMSACLLKSEFQ